MLGQSFYHETIRKVIVGFGTMFNDIQLVRKDGSGNISQTMKVPLAYGPREKFLVRLRDDADLAKQVAITLFEEAIDMGIKAIHKGSEGKLNPDAIEIAVIDAKDKFCRLPHDEAKDYVKKAIG